MEFGICLLSVIPVRSQPSDKSEMSSQVIFGELTAINYKYQQWLNIRTIHDNYEGWVDEKQLVRIPEDEFRRLADAAKLVSIDIVQVVNDYSRNTMVPVLIGSTIPYLENGRFTVNGFEYGFEGNATSSLQPVNKEFLVENALMYLDAPYQWGGRSLFGIDCSGFTQMAYKLCGINLLRDAELQATQGEVINFLAEAIPGDLVFFDNDEGKIIHTGIIISDQRIIHASGKVRIDQIDHNGIYNQDLKKYTHKLRVIRRIL